MIQVEYFVIIFRLRRRIYQDELLGPSLSHKSMRLSAVSETCDDIDAIADHLKKMVKGNPDTIPVYNIFHQRFMSLCAYEPNLCSALNDFGRAEVNRRKTIVEIKVQQPSPSTPVSGRAQLLIGRPSLKTLNVENKSFALPKVRKRKALTPLS